MTKTMFCLVYVYCDALISVYHNVSYMVTSQWTLKEWMNVLASEQRSLCSILSIKAVFSLTLVLETLKNMFLYANI